MDVGKQLHTKNVWKDLTEDVVAQIWAEAKVRWQMGEQLYLTGGLEDAARDHQEQHRDSSPMEGMIHDFMSKPVPSDWLKWDLDRRRDFWAANVTGNYQLVARDRMTVIEVWCELFLKNKSDLRANDKKEINSCIANCPGWKRADKSFYGGVTYGTQRGYIPAESGLQIAYKALQKM